MRGVQGFVRFVRQLDGCTYEKQDSEGNLIQVQFSLKSPATAEQIRSAEEQLGMNLPRSFQSFLLEFNGGCIFDYEGLDGFEILSPQDLHRVTANAQKNFDGDWRDGLVVFARYIGEENYLAFDLQAGNDEAKVVDCFVEGLPSNWEAIADTFDEFLEKLLAANGRKYWME